MKKQKNILTVLTIVVSIYVIATTIVGVSGKGMAAILPLLVISFGVFIFAHGMVRYRLKDILAMIGIGMAVSLFFEALSIATGFPYSSYHYTELLGPQLLGFPIMVMVGYGVGAYVFWTVAETIVGKFNTKLSGANLVFIPIVASFLATAWDLVMDPIGATVFKAYIWENHGPYFGIPFSNFLGWYLCTYTLFQLVALVLYRQDTLETSAIIKKKAYWYQAIIMYAAIFIQAMMLMISGGNEHISIASGQVFQTNDIYQSMTLVGITAILFPTFIGFVNVFNAKDLE
jgi:putative membrane protein